MEFVILGVSGGITICDLERNRTSGPRFRKALLYPSELRGRV